MTMAAEQTMIQDMIEEYGERIGNIKKYYPYFCLMETNFSLYKEGKYDVLDMGYLVMSILRFFIEENNFKEKYVSYLEYVDFVKVVLKRDFELFIDEQEEEGIAAYIFDKIKNDGKPFAFTYFDPMDRKKKSIRTKLLENHIQDGTIFYSITADAIEFYLDTKEVKDESGINVEQLLLEKLIASQNFRGAVEVVKRINSEVSKMQRRKNEVLNILSYDVFEGVKVYEKFQETGIRWFADEQKLFQKNMDLIEKALSRASQESETGLVTNSYYNAIDEIYTLEVELKKAIHKHGELLKACTELQIKTDEIVAKSKFNALRTSFHFKNQVKRLMDMDRTDLLENIAKPLLSLHVPKTFSFKCLDDLLHIKDDTKEESEKVIKQEEVAYVYEDEVEAQRIASNYSLILDKLLKQLEIQERFTLMEFNHILQEHYGERIFRNGDYYSFLVHLCQKKEYHIEEIRKKPDTFLEEIIDAHLAKSSEVYEVTDFAVQMDEMAEMIKLFEFFEMSNIIFIRQ
jgi:hypothetical protein